VIEANPGQERRAGGRAGHFTVEARGSALTAEWPGTAVVSPVTVLSRVLRCMKVKMDGLGCRAQGFFRGYSVSMVSSIFPCFMQ